MAGFRSQQFKSIALNAFSAALMIFAGASYAWSAAAPIENPQPVKKACNETINNASPCDGTCATGTCTIQNGNTTAPDGTVITYFYCKCV